MPAFDPHCTSDAAYGVQPAWNISTSLDMWWFVAPADPCLDAQHVSTCRVSDILAGDLEAPGQLERVAQLRSWNREIVFTAVNAQGVKMAINWALSLRAQGIEHFFVITDSPALCKALFYSEARISCAWTSYLHGCVCMHCSVCDLVLTNQGCCNVIAGWNCRMQMLAQGSAVVEPERHAAFDARAVAHCDPLHASCTDLTTDCKPCT